MNDDDEAEDGFFVPDGYLSENEVQHLLTFSCTAFYISPIFE